MFNKIFVVLFTIMLLNITSFCAERAQAEYKTAEPENILKMPYSTIAPYLNLDREQLGYTAASMSIKSTGTGETAGNVNYYPVLYYKEYFYRDNSTQPIRDFRYYNVKSFVPNRELVNKEPIRDFRVEMWKNKHYK
jgi:hypothetical protein